MTDGVVGFAMGVLAGSGIMYFVMSLFLCAYILRENEEEIYEKLYGRKRK